MKKAFITLNPLVLITCAVSLCWGQPMSGNYDIGGGGNHYTSIVSAVNALTSRGMSGPVTFNVYFGTYNGQSLIQNITGLGQSNPLIFQSASEDRPIVTNPTTGTHTGNGFHIRGSSYVTIRGFEFQNCGYCGVQTYYGNSSSDSSTHITIENNYFNRTSNYMMHTYRTNHARIIGNEFNAMGSYGFRIRYTTNSIVANNMSYGGTSYGAYIYNDAGTEFYYNSIVSSGSRCFYLGGSSSTGCTIKNNIFCNLGSGTSYAAYYYTNTNPQSDYNCYWAPNCNVGYYGGACQTLAQFRAATGGDAHSIEADPGFLSATDLHISDTSVCRQAGIGIPGIETDIDYEPRNRNTPCIGCDEIGGIRVSLEPRFPPYILPAGGGIIDFNVEMENSADSVIPFDAWTELLLPNGQFFGPLLLRQGIRMPPNTIFNRNLSQLIPTSAPAGDYSYIAKCGIYPDSVLSDDSFPFIKSPAPDNSPSQYHDWTISGWENEGPESLTGAPDGFELAEPYPNPFNAETALSFKLQTASDVRLAIYDIRGRELAVLVDGFKHAGTHYYGWNASSAASGVYFVSFNSGGRIDVKKLLLVK